jgi:membrane protein implicated in regulation of membrane protease activity
MDEFYFKLQILTVFFFLSLLISIVGAVVLARWDKKSIFKKLPRRKEDLRGKKNT